MSNKSGGESRGVESSQLSVRSVHFMAGQEGISEGERETFRFNFLLSKGVGAIIPQSVVMRCMGYPSKMYRWRRMGVEG